MNRRLTLAASVSGAVIVALDGTVLTVAQPTLQRDLGASFAEVQWTGTGYLIAVASLLVFAGRLGDRYGHHRLFALGMLLRRAGARRTTVAAMVVLALGILILSRASGTLALCTGFALLGAGFGTVMVAATHVVVRQAAVASAGVAGGLQQTAMNVGPTVGVAVVTPLMGLGHAFALVVLVGVALVGALAGLALPVLSATSGTDRAHPSDRIRVPTRP
ncbi:MFS transporter [Streptomyces sp. NBC_00444]|uniref:MFS transporter n=1 Tax=Streptomyces sp. NBC_00444 TaxID=2975744 RepID=UPI002E1BDD87